MLNLVAIAEANADNEGHRTAPLFLSNILRRIIMHAMANGGGKHNAATSRMVSALLSSQVNERPEPLRATLCLQEFERIRGRHTFLAGDHVSLADLYLVPIIFYLKLTPEGELLAPHKGLAAWWEAMSDRKSVKATAPNLG